MRAWELLLETKDKTHISPSGVKTNMDPNDDDYEINYGKNGLVSKFRKDQGLDVETGSKKVSEADTPKVGRAWQHAEDLIIVDGSQGALRALDSLEAMASDVKDVRIKWDGSPAIYFGRDESGEFVLTDKSGFTAKGYDGKTKSPQDLQKMLLSRGKEPDESRRAFAGNMGKLFNVLESIVSPDFRGFIFADVLFFSQPEVNKSSEFEFTPNTVTYHIPVESDLGKQIARSRAGVVMHQHDGKPIMGEVPGIDMNGPVFAVSHISITKPPKVNVTAINQARAFVKKNATAIDSLLDDAKLAAMKMTDLKNTLYKFVNSQVPTKNFSNLDARFDKWLPTSGVSAPKQAKIADMKDKNPGVFAAIFDTLEMIMKVKDEIIDDLDMSSPVKQTIGGQPGGEGYIKGDIKLVPRAKFTAANIEKHS
jgi:hypothetical protein